MNSGKHPTIELLQGWLDATEGEHFEFKEAKDNYSFEKLARYCCALGNEGGGKIIFGVTDKRPRVVVGSHAFKQPEQTRRALMDKYPAQHSSAKNSDRVSLHFTTSFGHL